MEQSEMKYRLHSIKIQLRRFSSRFLEKLKHDVVLSTIIETIFTVFLYAVYKKYICTDKIHSHPVFLISLIVWILVFISYKYIKRKYVADSRMELRHVLIKLREIFVLIKMNLSSKSFEVDSLDNIINGILNGIFNAVSQNNTNLDKHFRVSLMLPIDKSNLVVKYYANSENIPPLSMLTNKYYAHGEGCAGTAWQLRRPVVVESVPLELIKAKQESEEPIFLEMYNGQADSIKSIISYPILDGKIEDEINNEETEDRILEQLDIYGVLNIDTDIEGFFDEKGIQHRDIRIKLYPYIRLLETVLEARRTFTNKVNNSSST